MRVFDNYTPSERERERERERQRERLNKQAAKLALWPSKYKGGEGRGVVRQVCRGRRAGGGSFSIASAREYYRAVRVWILLTLERGRKVGRRILSGELHAS